MFLSYFAVKYFIIFVLILMAGIEIIANMRDILVYQSWDQFRDSFWYLIVAGIVISFAIWLI